MAHMFVASPRVVAAFDLSRFRRLVDLGGATGHLAVAACERYPGLRATVFELPRVISFAREQVERKYTGGAHRGLRFMPGDNRLQAGADPLVVDDVELERGVAAGVLVEDTRLRDALRTLARVERVSAGAQPEFRVQPLDFPRPSIVDDALFAVDAAVVEHADEIRLRRYVDELERRLQSVESLVAVRAERGLRRLFER